MFRLGPILVFGSLGLLFAACNGCRQEKPIWEQVKITELAPPARGQTADTRPLMSASFDVYIFEMPAENVSDLNDVWQTLNSSDFGGGGKGRLRFNDHMAFKSSAFSASFSTVSTWNEIADLLRDAGCKKVSQISILVAHGHTNDLDVAKLKTAKKISYTSKKGSLESVTLGPGNLALRIVVQRIQGSGNTRDVDVQLVFVPTSSIWKLAQPQKYYKFLFSSVGFGLKMGVNDLFLLGPAKYLSSETSLANYVFNRERPTLGAQMLLPTSDPNSNTKRVYSGPVVRLFLFVCTTVID